jgi:predicted RNA-binding Zn-ribbon protein involved in translation (DUF1610 family)
VSTDAFHQLASTRYSRFTNTHARKKYFFMAWKCPECGKEPIDDSIGTCDVCGYRKFPAAVVLRCEASGKEIEIRLPGTFGNRSLARLEDPGLRFVSVDQFKLEKRLDAGSWAVVPAPGATNATFLDGQPIPPEGALLDDGSRLSIKDKHFFLTVILR